MKSDWPDHQSLQSIPCDEGGWVRLDKLLSNELLWTHRSRRVGYPLSIRSTTEHNREMQRRLQLLFDGNCINYKGDGKIRLQFLGIKVAVPPNLDNVEQGAQPFDHGMVTPDIQYRELQQSGNTGHLDQSRLEQSDYWVKPRAIRATSGHNILIHYQSLSWRLTPQNSHCQHRIHS